MDVTMAGVVSTVVAVVGAIAWAIRLEGKVRVVEAVIQSCRMQCDHDREIMTAEIRKIDSELLEGTRNLYAAIADLDRIVHELKGWKDGRA